MKKIKPIYLLLIGGFIGLLMFIISDTVFVLTKNSTHIIKLPDWLIYLCFIVVVLPLFFQAFRFSFKNQIIGALMALFSAIIWWVICSVITLCYHVYVLQAPL